jgi:glutamine amidotransferase
VGHPLFAGIETGTAFYFVHSYVATPLDPAIVLAESEHGSRFPAAIGAGSLLGVQFHPERSGADGLRLLANFAGIAGGSVAGAGQQPVATLEVLA